MSAEAFIVVLLAAGCGHLIIWGAVDLYRMVRYGPALYRSCRKLGSSRWHALKVVVWP